MYLIKKNCFFILAGLVMPVMLCSARVICIPADYQVIQDGIDAAVDHDMVVVADGTYSGPGNKNLDFSGKIITVMSESGSENCVIDCEGQGRGFHFHSGETGMCLIRGFTIRNGTEDMGGAILCTGASPTIADCIITGNQSTSVDFYSGGGGGINCYDANPYILQCEITGNFAQMGGAISCVGCHPDIVGCHITGNTCGSGSAIFCLYDGPNVHHTRIIANNGCAVESWVANPGFYNCTLADNTDSGFASGIYCRDASSVVLVGCTVTDTIYAYFDSIVTYENCIQWAEFESEFGSIITATYSDMFGGCSGTGNIDLDPLFVSGSHGDLYLSHLAAGQPGDSPCIDMGSGPASDICFTNPFGTICMDELTTRTDDVTDSGIADMGYHHPPGGVLPTLTPISTFTPEPSPTATPSATFTPSPVATPTATSGIPTSTPEPSATVTPFATSTPSPVATSTATSGIPTFTPESSPTVTPSATFTPSPVATPTATSGIPTFTPESSPTVTPTTSSTSSPLPSPTATSNPTGVELILNGSIFEAGDPFILLAACSGPAGMNADLYIILDVYGTYWFWPYWTKSPSWKSITLGNPLSDVYIILNFIWPEGNHGEAGGLKFWGAMLDPDLMEIIGDFDMVNFGYR